MRIEKNKLLQIVKESKQQLDEMAKWENPKSRPLFDADGNHIGHRMRVSLDDPKSPSINVIFTCEQDINEFIETHQELIQQIKEKEFNDEDEHLQKELVFTNATCPKYRPHQKVKEYYDENGNLIPNVSGGRYQVSGEPMSLQENINRKLKSVLFEQLMMDKDLEQHMTDCSIPFFKVRERRYEDRHNIANTNDEIHYGSDVFNLYEATNDFLKDVLNKSIGLESDVEKRETHLARMRNKIYRNWEPTKKNQKKYLGLTPKYYLEAKGYTEKNYDVNILSRFDINGNRFGNQFNWTFKLKVTYGKKISVENLIKSQNVKTFKDIITRKEVEFEGVLDDNKNNILSKPEVLNGLYEGLNEFKDELKNISTDDALEMANYFQFEVSNEMDESFNRIIKSVLKESGVKKKIRIKESDLIKLLSESIIKNILEQENFDDFITKTKENRAKYEEEQQANMERDQNDGQGDDEGMKDQVNLTLATDDSGKFYILKNADTNNPEIVATTS
ncbi:MAG: hypothetical protein WC755_09595 [Candidatus Woesearchaeota archaeon]|jgi:hypothetical protein